MRKPARTTRGAAGSRMQTGNCTQVTMPAARYAPSDIVIAIAGVEVRVAIGADVGYVAGLVAELRARC